MLLGSYLGLIESSKVFVDKIRWVDPAVPYRTITGSDTIPHWAVFFADLEVKMAEIGAVRIADGTDLFAELNLAFRADHFI